MSKNPLICKKPVKKPVKINPVILSTLLLAHATLATLFIQKCLFKNQYFEHVFSNRISIIKSIRVNY